IYLDASALVKRYVAEPGSDLVRSAMQTADGWYICRIGFVETVRAVGLAVGHSATQTVREEWPSFGVVEVDQDLVERAARLTLDDDLRSLDALHLAAALLLPFEDIVLATWDRRLHFAALSHRLSVLPDSLP
ncbi:MAG: type II toxin-antitoxin system VapC family toxin, partial [Mycobacterium sp.]